MGHTREALNMALLFIIFCSLDVIEEMSVLGFRVPARPLCALCRDIFIEQTGNSVPLTGGLALFSPLLSLSSRCVASSLP